MTYTDRIHGTVEITEPVICELIESDTLQRLKKIDQYGPRAMWEKPNVQIGPLDSTRFVHSMCVYLILERFGAPLEEQIAGLIHDVSHAAFSHCADYAFGENNEKRQHFQDSVFERFVRNSEIPAILHRHGFSPDRILDDRNFPLKELPLPDLCADRIAYSLQDGLNFEEIDEAECARILDALITRDGRWVFRSYDAARLYAAYFLMMNRIYWSGPQAGLMLKTVGEALKLGLEKGYISESDLFTDDKTVSALLNERGVDDRELAGLLNRIENGQSFESNREQYDLHTFCKSRAVDPLCEHEGRVVRVSDIDASFGAAVRDALIPAEHFIKFLVKT